MPDSVRHAVSALRRWAGFFFQPCPHGARTLAGAALAAMIAACLLLLFHLGARGWSRTALLLPRPPVSGLEPGLESDRDAAVSLLTPLSLPPPLSGPPGRALPPEPEQHRGGVDTFVRAPVRADTLPYLDLPGVPLEEAAKQVDYALTQVMLRLDLGWNAFRLISHERRQARTGGTCPLQRLRVYLPLAEGHTPETFAKVLGGVLAVWSERAGLRKPEGALRLDIVVDGVVTHEIFLSPEPGARMAPPAPGTPLLTIVIDDMGASLEAARRILSLDMPVTLSVWPRAAHAARVADMAWQAGREVLIHQPAEPLDFPAMQPGLGTLFTRMSRAEIAALFRDSVRRVPHAVGVNNHMGSRFTANKASAEALCAIAAEHGLFVLDSLTHSRSLLARQAVRQGLAAYRRSVFLDDPLSRDAVRAALREAEHLARTHGQAIAIGHPHPETLDTLQEWLRTRDTGIRLVSLRFQRPGF